MANINHSVITGGTFTQLVHNNNFKTLSQSSPTPWDRLQTATAPVALHNSAERFDPPRCHPNTRIAVMDELIDWVIRRGDSGNARVLWLSGPAGAGKSAIAQSLCELCSPHKFLLASFFFNRSDSSRNNSKRLVATITSQIYKTVPRQYQTLILDVIENDPLVFDLSIEAQFKALIMDPLRNLFEDDHFNNYHAPRLIVIDGLDECSPRAVQVNILRAVQTISTQRSSPFIFLIASRPEHDIQMFFRSHGMGALFHQLDLDGSYLPDLDIEIFLKDKLQETCATHPLKESIPQGWPASRIIEQLVQKSSGQFIYASVVVKFVTSDRHYPPDRLEIVLGLRPPRRDLPFAELDALYSHILSCAEDVNLVLRILRVVILFEDARVDAFSYDVETLCKLDRGECRNALCDLQSVIQIRPRKQQICLLHKSLSDYFQDSSRSHRYYIDTSPSMVVPLAIQCLRVISDPMLGYQERYVKFVLRQPQDLLISNIQICHDDLMSFSLMNFWKPYHGSSEKAGIKQRNELLSFSFRILNDLCALESTEYEYVYHHYLRQYPKLVHQYADVYSSWRILTGYSFIAMIMIFVLLGYSEDRIFSEAFGASQPLQSFSNLQAISAISRPMSSFPILSHAVAKHCVNSLTNDRYSKSAAFALECLPLILPDSKLSADLNEACHSLKSILDCSSGGRSLAYDFRGRSYAALGHTDAEMRKMTRALERKACTAMQKYMERYANRENLDSN